MESEPQIKAVDRVDNSAIVEFEGESEPAIFPAKLLHAAKGVAAAMIEREQEDEQARKEATESL
jgi:hypothetical protein